MTDPWPRQGALQAAREEWLRPGAVTDGFRGVCVTQGEDGLLLTFQWRRDPNTYVLRFPWPGTAEDDERGIPTDSPESWAEYRAVWLMEELHTGFCGRARRTTVNGYVELEPRLSSTRTQTEYFVSDVPIHDTRLWGQTGIRKLSAFPGYWVAEVGLDVSVPRLMIEECRLICWLQASVSYGKPLPVGHAVASWHEDHPATAVIDLVQVQDHIPGWVVRDLVLTAFLSARTSGALRVVTALDDPVFSDLGFSAAPSGGLQRGTLG